MSFTKEKREQIKAYILDKINDFDVKKMNEVLLVIEETLYE